MKGQVVGILNLVKVAEEVLREEIAREAQLRNFSGNAITCPQFYKYPLHK
jgi:hypothetical protein